MIKKTAIFLIGALAACSFYSCNSDSPSSYEEITYSSTLVKAFNLKRDKKILVGLDSVFFSIDLVNARIFNADSLPKGTDVSRLLVNISTDACSKVELHVPRPGQADTIINYLTNSTDSINFSNGPVKLHLVSYDGRAERDYTISVNVHLTEPDLLYWSEAARRSLPGAIANPTEQKTVKCGATAVCLTTDGSRYSIAATSDPASDAWSVATPAFSFTPQIASLAATSSALFILADTGELFTSTDLGATWTSTSATWTHIYGGYGDSLLGVATVDGHPAHVTYPASSSASVPDDCPISATGTLAYLSTRWSDNPQAVFVGGRLADGSLSNTVWGFDGKLWARLSKSLPRPQASVALMTYDVAQTDSTNWTVKSVPALLAIGALTDEGPSAEVYISRDLGVNWKKADKLLQLPDYIDPRYGAQPLIFESTIDARSSAAWTYCAPRPLPAWFSIESPQASRASELITSWQCPYIYLFGGYDSEGILFNSIWKGVINRLTFKPLQ